MSDYVTVGMNPATVKWNVVVFVKECENYHEAKAQAEKLAPKIVEALKVIRE